MVKSFKQGWGTTWNPEKGKWVYSDTQEDLEKIRPCKRCGKHPTKEGHDACLGKIPGVMSACCGHGIYVGFVMKRK